MHHVMSPTGVAVLLLLALVVDYMSVGPNSLRDRLAFLLGLPAVREGFNGSPLDKWTVQALSNLIEQLKHAADGAYIAGAATSVVLSAAVGILAIYTVGALLPEQLAAKVGGWVKVKFPTSAMYRINIKLWICAALLGMLADLPRGAVGVLLVWAVDGLTSIVAVLPAFLFGVN